MSAFEGRNPVEDYKIINKELENFNKKIMDKPQIVIANKMDMESSLENLEKFKSEVKCEVFPISSMTGEGIDAVLIKLADMLDTIERQPLYEEEKFESHVLYKFKKEQPFKIFKEGDTFVVTGDEIEKMLRMTWFASDEAFARFSKKLRRLGIDDKLKEMGIVEGDTIRILDYEFEYKE